jgi:hypothetical protein
MSTFGSREEIEPTVSFFLILNLVELNQRLVGPANMPPHVENRDIYS